MEKSSTSDLLVVGARDFLKASAAVAKFGDEVYDAGLVVMKRQAPTLNGASIRLDRDKVKEQPEKGYISSDNDGTDASIGPYAPLGNGQYFNLYVWWRIDDEHSGVELCSAVASLGYNTRQPAKALYQALRRRPKSEVKIDADGYEVYIERPLKPEDFVTLESHFEALVKRWITFSTGLGSLKKHLKY